MVARTSQTASPAPYFSYRMKAIVSRRGRIIHVHINGQVIRTTLKHPFYFLNKDWLAVGEMQPDDRIASHNATWVSVEEVHDTGEYETVYNVRVADWHTYFVGEVGWGWSAWGHNVYFQGHENSGRFYVKNIDSSNFIPVTGTALETLARARAFSTRHAADAFATNLNRVRISLLQGLNAKVAGFNVDIVNDLIRKNDGYSGEVDCDGIFFDLVSARQRDPNNPNANGGRPRLTWEQAVDVFGYPKLRWTPPTRPMTNFADLEPFKPTSPPHGVALPTPVAVQRYEVDTNGNAVDERHRSGAYHEQLLAYQIHGGGVLGAAEIVIRWGDKIGSNGADVISVHPTTGRVTLWDSKYRTRKGAPFASETFTKTDTAKAARLAARDFIERSSILPAELKAFAVLSIDD